MEVQPLSLPQTAIGNTVESTFDFHHSRHVGENHLAGLAKLGPRGPSLLPPQRTTVPSGGHVVPSTFLSPWTAYEPRAPRWEYCLTSFFFFFFGISPESVSAAVRNFIVLGVPLATVSHGATQWLMEPMRTSDTTAIAFQKSSLALSGCTGGAFSTCRLSYALELWNLCLVLPQHNRLINTCNCKGPKYPKKVVLSSTWERKIAIFFCSFGLFFKWLEE